MNIWSFKTTLKNIFIAGMMGNVMFSFAFSAAAIFWADPQPSLKKVLLTLAAVFSARTAGCLFNNLADRHYDAENPRTKNRPLADGSLSVRASWGAIAFFAIVTSISAFLLNVSYIFLLPIPLFICFFYAFTKRFTWLCHFILGVACAAAPVGAWLVFADSWNIFYILLIGVMVGSWTAGYDILYATQDYEFDKKAGLFSIPARFGLRWARVIAGGIHVVTVLLFFLWGIVKDFNSFYFIGAVVCTGILIVEHCLFFRNHYEKAQLAFSLNQFIGVSMLVFTLLDTFL